MLWETQYDPNAPADAFHSLVEAWDDPETKVFVLRAAAPVDDIRAMLEANFRYLGTPVPLAEDARVADRSKQRTDELWFEVRYDPTVPDAYRHSANAQPLHTDGSYIPSFPNATLMGCVANAGEGGETTFIDANDLVSCMRRENPDLLGKLAEASLPHERSGDRRVERVIDSDHRPSLVNWNFYCVADDVDERQKSLAQAFFDYLQTSPGVRSHILEVKLAPGDCVTWKDREVLHGRNGFRASKESERFIWKCAIDIGVFGP